jgi:hypothetical protein
MLPGYSVPHFKIKVSHLIPDDNHLTKVGSIVKTVKIKWDITRYTDRLGKKPSLKETQAKLDQLSRRFPPENPPINLSKPAIILDMHDRIIAWYLPGILTPDRQVWHSIFRQTH